MPKLPRTISPYPLWVNTNSPLQNLERANVQPLDYRALSSIGGPAVQDTICLPDPHCVTARRAGTPLLFSCVASKRSNPPHLVAVRSIRALEVRQPPQTVRAVWGGCCLCGVRTADGSTFDFAGLKQIGAVATRSLYSRSDAPILHPSDKS